MALEAYEGAVINLQNKYKENTGEELSREQAVKFLHKQEFISNEINNILYGSLTGVTGWGIAYVPEIENITGLTETYSVGYFTRHTQTFYQPFLQTDYDDLIEDDRNTFVVNKTNKTVSILTRNEFYKNSIVDFDDKFIENQPYSMLPLNFDSKYIDLSYSKSDTELCKDYSGKYGKESGSMTLNTGYQFNTNTYKLFDNNIFSNYIAFSQHNTIFGEDADPKYIPALYSGKLDSSKPSTGQYLFFIETCQSEFPSSLMTGNTLTLDLSICFNANLIICTKAFPLPAKIICIFYIIKIHHNLLNNPFHCKVQKLKPYILSH
jgi:hypothetical protein